MLFSLFSSAYFVNLHMHFLFYLTSAYILGIACYALGIFACTCLAATALATYSFYVLPRHRLAITSYAIAFMAGAAALYYQRQEHGHFHEYIDNKTFTIQGHIANIATIDHRQFRHCTSIAVTQMQQKGSTVWQPVDKTVSIYLKNSPDVMVADIVEVRDVSFKKSNGESFNNYAIKEGIAATLFLPAIDYSLLHRPAYSYIRWIFYLREKIVNNIKSKTDVATFNLFTVLFLGKHTAKNSPKEHMKDAFSAWGLTHYLARSGLHMVIFVLIWHMLLNVLPIAFLAKEILLLTLGLWYYALSWPSISFNRAFATFLFQKMCTLFFVRTDLLHLLTIVCLITLISNPCQLFFLDFQLSFGLTFALALMNRIATYQRAAS